MYRVRSRERIQPKFGHPKISGPANDADLADDKSHLRRINVQPSRFDIDGEIRLGYLPRFDFFDQRLDSSADAGARFAAFLIADKAEEKVGGRC